MSLSRLSSYMMTSFVDNIPTIIKKVAELRPMNTLDIGAGFGKYGILIKEALLSIQAEENSDIYPKKNFRLVACENSPYFINQGLLQNIYDEVCEKSALDLTEDELSQFDLILLIDVVEHWTRQQYVDFMMRVPATTKVLISTPKDVAFYDLHYYDCPPHITQFNSWDFQGGEELSTKDSFIYLI